MGLVLELLKPEIEKTIKGLDSKNFPPDPIAGPHFSKITSVMSSAYKRHGYILERAILELGPQSPMVGSLPACCAPATSSHAADAPPSSVMNSRRFIQAPRRHGRAASVALRGQAS